MLDKIKDKELLKAIEEQCRKAVDIALRVQGIPDTEYSLKLIENPDIPDIGRCYLENNEIQINISRLQPMDLYGTVEDDGTLTKENRETFYLLSAILTAFHEARHIYQKETICAWRVNRAMRGRFFTQRESDKKCELWEKEICGLGINKREGTDVEADAEMFSAYMIHRYPIRYDFGETCKRLGILKRRYNRIPVEPVVDARRKATA